MDETTLNGIWDYYMSLEEDLSSTSRYIEPKGQESVYSFEFAKLLVLACIEIEAVFKEICLTICENKLPQDIGKYKEIVLGKYPKIVESTVSIRKLGKDIKPFENWDKCKLSWWDAYQKVKHSREKYFVFATYLNVVTAISALHILIHYLSQATGIPLKKCCGSYVRSEYGYVLLSVKAGGKLPDFIDK